MDGSNIDGSLNTPLRKCMFDPNTFVEEYLDLNNIKSRQKVDSCMQFISDNIISAIDTPKIHAELIWVLEELREFFSIDKNLIWESIKNDVTNVDPHTELYVHGLLTSFANFRLEYHRQLWFYEKHGVYITTYQAKEMTAMIKNMVILSTLSGFPLQEEYNKLAESKLEV